MQKVLDSRSYYTGAARRADGDVERVEEGGVQVFYYYGGDGGERAFAGADEVRGARDVAECVCGVGNGEILYGVIWGWEGRNGREYIRSSRCS